MKTGHRYLVAAAVVAVVLIAALAAPAVGRTTLAEAQAKGSTPLTLQNETNETPTATPDETDGTPTAAPSAIPGRIEAEDCDDAFDRTPGNQGGEYARDDVDIETGGSGYVVAGVTSSEWLAYDVDVAEAGTYTATFRGASPWNDRQIRVRVDGVLVAKVIVPNTGSLDIYEDATAEIALTAGSTTIRLQFYRDTQNFDSMTFEAAGNVTPEPTPTGNVTGNVTSTPTGNVTGNATFTRAEADLQQEWRRLWEDHLFWTRMVIVNIADTPGGMNESLDRLFRNRQEMEDALQPYYNESGASAFGDLLEDHLVIATVLVAAERENNTTAAAALRDGWYENGDQIATALADLNPACNETEVRDLWRAHLDGLLNEARMRLGKNATGEIEAYDDDRLVVLELADLFSSGILEQFPERFAGEKTVTRAELDLYNEMRELWTDQAVYTRLYIIRSLEDAPDAPDVATRLLENQADLGNAFRPLYGDAAGDGLAELLTEHVLIAVALVDAVKANDTAARAAAEQNWSANAHEIAGFLGAANPNWPEPGLQDLLNRHLSTTGEGLLARAAQDYAGDVAARDAAYENVLVLSDTLAGGIVAQFPAAFGR
jgi:hypothetical protein